MLDKPEIGTIDPLARIGAMRLAVADLAKVKDFYQRVIGLSVLDDGNDAALLGIGTRGLIQLEARPDGYRDPRSTGLFHIAFLLPSRADLADWLYHYLVEGYQLEGVGDHIVSEALYLSDPEGNGIEVYRDRPREDWTYTNGQIVMDTLPIDLDDLMEDKTGQPYSGAPDGTANGHIHLSVSNVAEETDFYQRVFGMGLQVGMGSASFLSAGDYHHHLGLNSWQRSIKRTPDESRLGLLDFEVVVSNSDELDGAVQRFEENGVEIQENGSGQLRVVDPDGIGVVLTV